MSLNQHLFNIKRKLLFFIEEHYPALPLITALTYKCDMGCAYCNSKGLDKIFREEMNIDNFTRLLGWMKKQGMHKIMFSGGEPTQHTRFKDILNLCKKNHLRCYMASNCRYGDDINEAIAANIDVLFVNCSTGYALKERADFLNKLRFLRKHNTKLVLRVNVLTADSDEIYWVKQIAGELGARIRIGIINSPEGQAKPPDMEKIRLLIDFTEGFAKQCLEERIHVYLARPLPRCLFDHKKWRQLRQLILVKSKCFVGYRGNYASRAVVNPDLSVFGCFKNLKQAGNILDFPDLNKLSEFYKIKPVPDASRCFLDKGNNCAYLAANQCNGACFDHA
jgi:organic radical activating enzyme